MSSSGSSGRSGNKGPLVGAPFRISAEDAEIIKLFNLGDLCREVIHTAVHSQKDLLLQKKNELTVQLIEVTNDLERLQILSDEREVKFETFKNKVEKMFFEDFNGRPTLKNFEYMTKMFKLTKEEILDMLNLISVEERNRHGQVKGYSYLPVPDDLIPNEPIKASEQLEIKSYDVESERVSIFNAWTLLYCQTHPGVTQRWSIPEWRAAFHSNSIPQDLWAVLLHKDNLNRYQFPDRESVGIWLDSKNER